VSVGGFLVVLFVFVLFAAFCVYAPHDLAKLARERERDEVLDELWADGPAEVDGGRVSDRVCMAVDTRLVASATVDDPIGGAA